MTDRDSTKFSIGDVVGSITSRLDVTSILHDYIRHLSLIVDQQESLARDEAVSSLGETGEALFRSVRDAHRAQAQRGALPAMESVLNVPGLLELATPPWEILLREIQVAAVEEAPVVAVAPIAPPAPATVVPPAPPAEPEIPESQAPEPVEPVRVPSEARVSRPAAVSAQVAPRKPLLYGIEIEPVNLEAAKKIVEEAREAVSLREPNAYFAYDKRVGRHKWRKELYQMVFRDEAHAAGLPVPGEAADPAVEYAGMSASGDAHAEADSHDADIPDDDIVFGDEEAFDEPVPEPPVNAPVDAGVPAFLSDTSEAPAAGPATDAFGHPVDEPVESWLRPFGSTADDHAEEEPPRDENRVVAFAPPRAPPLRPAKVAPGLARPIN